MDAETASSAQSGPSTTKRAPTIIDVARVAGVSKSTVSAVLRGVAGTSEQSIDRVNEAVGALGYRPNDVARQLVGAESNLLGVVVGDLSNPFFAEMAVHVERSATQAGYSTIFCNTLGDADRELAAVGRLMQQRVAGILFLSLDASEVVLQEAVGGRSPVVFATCRGSWADSVCIDDVAAARVATEHLIALGHTSIACLTSPSMETLTRAERLSGYRAALDAAGLDPGPELTWRDANSIEVDGDERLLEDLLVRPPFTAVFAFQDSLAIALLDVANSLDLGAPEDFAICGIDNISESDLVAVSLTTVAQPFDDAARQAVGQLVDRIRGQRTGAPTLTTLPAVLIPRRTTIGRQGQPALRLDRTSFTRQGR